MAAPMSLRLTPFGVGEELLQFAIVRVGNHLGHVKHVFASTGLHQSREDQSAAVRLKVLDKNPPFHTVTSSSE